VHLTDPESSIFVAGHRGLVGSATIQALRAGGYSNLIVRSRDTLDLRDQAAVRAFFEAERPEFVVLAAARVGGILANDTQPADFLADNLIIQHNVIEGAALTGVRRLVFLGSSCIYPKLAPQPLREEYLLTAPLEPTNEWYAVAKIAGIKMCQAYRKQHGSDFVSLMPTNLYGPGDNFDLHSSHVLPALIRKFHEAGASRDARPTVTLWGTGRPRREFLFNEDLANAIRFVLEVPERELFEVAPDGMLNVGTGVDLPISQLAALIRDLVDVKAEIEYDTSKPDGTPRKLMDVSRMERLGWRFSTPLEEGIRRTYEWWLRETTASSATSPPPSS
jgi:GDP-L-fucose synthase